MTQTRRNHTLKKVIGLRLKQLIEVHLQLSLESVSKALGYSTSSTLRQACAGSTFLSVEKLSMLASLPVADGDARISIEWILTGEGEPLRPIGQTSQVHSLSERVKTAAPSLQKQIESFLDFHRAQSSPSRRRHP
jgi:protein gp37